MNWLLVAVAVVLAAAGWVLQGRNEEGDRRWTAGGYLIGGAIGVLVVEVTDAAGVWE